ncbi:MAG: flagellar basal body rod protein FlgC [Rickettsiales bacterium]|nr:MAG: flagellar basal body rod protein FlgC [Rickettsiales bacterium]
MKKLFVFIILAWVTLACTTLGCTSTALADDLKKAASIASYGTRFQAERIKIAAENIANESSTAALPGGDPYRRKVLFAENRYSKRLGTHVIRTKKIGFDKSAFITKYDPHHPAADSEGMVKYPNINRIIERADASEAQRGYEANLSVIEMTNSLRQKTIEAMGR